MANHPQAPAAGEPPIEARWIEWIARIEKGAEPDLLLARAAEPWAALPCSHELRRAAAYAAIQGRLFAATLAVACQPFSEDKSASLSAHARLNMGTWLLERPAVQDPAAASRCLRAMLSGLPREVLNGPCSAVAGTYAQAMGGPDLPSCPWAMPVLADLGFEFGAGQAMGAAAAIAGRAEGSDPAMLSAALAAGASPEAGLTGMPSPLSWALIRFVQGDCGPEWARSLLEYGADADAVSYSTDMSVAAMLCSHGSDKDLAGAAIAMLEGAGAHWRQLDARGRSVAFHAAGNAMWWDLLAGKDCGWDWPDALGRSPFSARMEEIGLEAFQKEVEEAAPGMMARAFDASAAAAGEAAPAEASPKLRAMFDWLRRQGPAQAKLSEAWSVEKEKIERFRAAMLEAEREEREEAERQEKAAAAQPPEQAVDFAEEAEEALSEELAGPKAPEPPHWNVCSEAALAEFAEDLEALKEESDVKAFKKRLKGRESRALFLRRPLALAADLRRGLDGLRASFPHFEQVIDHLEDHCALGEAGDGSLMIPPMLLIGGPGVGKTFFFQKVADLVATGYHILHMESMTASWILTGSSAQWSGGRPGKVFKSMAADATANPIFLLDEIDKAGGDQRFSVGHSLLPLLEQHSSSQFQDECLPLRIDASRINWVATANDASRVSAPLMSRLDPFTVRSPNARERRALSQAVYAALRARGAWGPKLGEELCSDTLDRLCQPMGDGAARDLRRALTTACAKAVRAGRSEVQPVDLPLSEPPPRAAWDAPAAQPGAELEIHRSPKAKEAA